MKRLFLLCAALAVVAAACGTEATPADTSGTTPSTTVPPTETTAMDDEMEMTDTTMSEDMDMSDDTTADGEMDDTMDDMDMDMDEMNMGDADATPAAEVEGAELVSASFELLETRPIGYDQVTGTADLARHDDGTTVTIAFEGLVPNTDFIAHLHEGVCADLGGPHFKFDPNGSDLPPNEIHLAFSSDENGSGLMTAENHGIVGDNAKSVVMHPVSDLDSKVACAEF